MTKLLSLLDNFTWSSAMVLGIPVALSVVPLFFRKFRAPVQYLMEFLAYLLSKGIKKTISHRFMARRYCRLQLNETTGFLKVPARDEVLLPIDTTYIPLNLEQATTKAIADHKTVLAFGGRIRVVGDPDPARALL